MSEFRAFFRERNPGCAYPANAGETFDQAFARLADTCAAFMDELAALNPKTNTPPIAARTPTTGAEQA